MSSFENTDQIFRRTDPIHVGQLYHLLEIFMEVADSDRIVYWLSAGSLLGAVRHRGIIPWDDDLDIQFLKEDEKKLWAHRVEFRRRGCELIKWWAGYRCFPAGGLKIKGHKHLFPFIDIFPSKIAGKKVLYARLRARFQWRNHYFFKHEVFPLVNRTFGPLSSPCPNQHEDYFNRLFGSDWNDCTYLSFDHQHEKKIKSKKVKLTDRSPAKYVMP